MTQHMLQLVVTAWLGGHIIGVLGMGTYSSTDAACHERGEHVVELLKRKHKRRGGRKTAFDYDCYETLLLRV